MIMPDTRKAHYTVGAARTLYGPQGPTNGMPGPSPRPMTTTMRLGKAPPPAPQSVEEHLTQAISKVPDISRRQRQALLHVLMATMRDIDFLRQLTAAAKASGPWSEAAVQGGSDSQGNTWA
jgi:hypothetical protein